MSRLSAADLDDILGLQLTVAWAGEKHANPARLSWWRTDILDEAGARDLLARLTPRTQEWAALEAVREAARRVDARTRSRSAASDELLSIFHLGFDVDEQLDERLATHKRGSSPPHAALGNALGIAPTFDPDAFSAWCDRQGARPRTESTPEGGRRLLAPPKDKLELVRALVSTLVPFSSDYPMPHARAER